MILVATPLAASENTYHRLSQEGIDLAYNLHFDAATAIFDQLIHLEPDNPHGYLLQSVNLYYRYQLEENPEELGKQFQRIVSAAIDRAEKRLHDKSRSLDMLFYLGTANIYLAAYHGWESNWLRAYIYGKEGIDYLKKLVAVDPNYYDAYLGLGLYHYYTGVIPNFARPVTFILGIEADKMKGLAELELAGENGTYSRAEALLFLGSIYLYLEKDYNKSLACLENLNRLYPENASFLMLLGENYQKVGDYERAITTLNYLVNEATNLKFPILMISSYFRLGNLYFNLKNFPEA